MSYLEGEAKFYDFVKNDPTNFSYPFYHVCIESYSLKQAIGLARKLGVDLKASLWKFPEKISPSEISSAYEGYNSRKKNLEDLFKEKSHTFPRGFPFCQIFYLDNSIHNCFSTNSSDLEIPFANRISPSAQSTLKEWEEWATVEIEGVEDYSTWLDV